MLVRQNKRMILTILVFAFGVVCACGGLSAPKSAWQPSPGHTQVPLWPGAVPDAPPITGPETVATTDTKELVAGKPWFYVSNVSRPDDHGLFAKGKEEAFRGATTGRYRDPSRPP
jgi:hypothetical protein